MPRELNADQNYYGIEQAILFRIEDDGNLSIYIVNEHGNTDYLFLNKEIVSKLLEFLQRVIQQNANKL